MSDLREEWKYTVAKVLTAMQPDGSAAVTAEQITMEIPPNPALGDIGIPLFTFAKLLKKAPQKIAEETAAALMEDSHLKGKGEVKAVGPYINIFLPKENVAAQTLESILTQKDRYGRTGSLHGKRIMIEFSSPNTNKPLHLGHLRNDAIGESLARIAAFSGAEVYKTNKRK